MAHFFLNSSTFLFFIAFFQYLIVKFSVKTPKSFFHCKSKRHIIKNIYLSNIWGILKTYVKFHLIMMNIKDVKPVSKTCIFFIQYVTLVTASNNMLFLARLYKVQVELLYSLWPLR